MDSTIEKLKKKAIDRQDINTADAKRLYEIGIAKPFLLMAHANEIREHFKGRRISLCGIINAKSGVCPENCRFCAQSAHYHTDAPVYPLVTTGEILEKARTAKDAGIHLFSVVTSGTCISDNQEWQVICRAVEGINNMGIRSCASLGLLDEETANGLARAGLFRYHHNLETARSFFGNICTTHDYEEDIKTLHIAKNAGLSVCSGGIIGLGENMVHRIELAMTLKEADVDSIPINILNPIPGTPLENVLPLTPIEVLLTVAIFRFILPGKDIKLCGGKEKNLRQLLPLSIIAGCNSLMTGNYLTTLGRDTVHDIEMIRDLGLEVAIEQ
ncbi:MAG: biotin synthase BioB [Syntrophorhabdaceae bacterium]|nr:biotin synthase BioB [Syntrophorhabdaceae bacterium]MDD5245063.1 biotin synthase BioB [Syntrophorhabdaceae bacterium]